ncbi:MAG: hypothetical protein P8Z00_13935 [Anaerolineales bacterium]
MKTINLPAIISPIFIGLILLEGAMLFIGTTGQESPRLSNIRLDTLPLVVIGMLICTQGEIGCVATAGQWTHPLAIIGYSLGGSILWITLAVFNGWKLHLINSSQQALLTIAVLAGLKVGNAVMHSPLTRV